MNGSQEERVKKGGMLREKGENRKKQTCVIGWVTPTS